MRLKTYLIFVIAVIFFTSSTNKLPNNANNGRSLVPNSETAIKIAEAIWLPIYGEQIYSETPFVATLMDSTIWIVKGTLHTALGGVAYIEIQKSDCKILRVTHGK
jgi:hypothetical protein